jgi:hypothetical protein
LDDKYRSTSEFFLNILAEQGQKHSIFAEAPIFYKAIPLKLGPLDAEPNFTSNTDLWSEYLEGI